MSNTDVEKIKKVLDQIRDAGMKGNWQERHSLMWGHAEEIRQYLYSFGIVGSDSSFIPAYVNDALARFFNTIDLITGSSTGRVLEIGGNPYLMTVMLKRFADFDLTLTNYFHHSVYEKAVSKGSQTVRSELFDEEYTFDYTALNVELSDYPFAPGYFDKVLFCEVLEHVIVDPVKIFPKLREIIRPGGELIVTTPNAVRLINFAHMIAGKNFFDRYHSQNGIYGRHNREFTLSEVVKFLEHDGFRVKTAKTLDRYNYDLVDMYVDSYDDQVKLPWSGTELRAKLQQIGASLEDRGDNIYVVAERI